MTTSNADKTPPSGNAPKSQPDAELNDEELEQISGGVALAKPTNPRRKNPNKVISDPPP